MRLCKAEGISERGDIGVLMCYCYQQMTAKGSRDSTYLTSLIESYLEGLAVCLHCMH